jgi:hypothetical protein
LKNGQGGEFRLVLPAGEAAVKKILFLTSLGVLLAFGLSGCAAPRGASDGAGIAKKVASAYGVDRFREVEAMRYTFNVVIGDKTIRRSWQWEPKMDRVTFFSAQGPVSYERKAVSAESPEELRKMDARFINDQYWLLFPYHLVWDEGVAVADAGEQALPLGGGSARRLVVTYPPSVGYTPGDVYELFVGGDDRIRQWVYRRDGVTEPTRMATWEDHRALGPLVVSLDHRVPDGKFRVWFTDVAVRLEGSQDWLRP